VNCIVYSKTPLKLNINSKNLSSPLINLKLPSIVKFDYYAKSSYATYKWPSATASSYFKDLKA
jgi:hypothetical protein